MKSSNVLAILAKPVSGKNNLNTESPKGDKKGFNSILASELKGTKANSTVARPTKNEAIDNTEAKLTEQMKDILSKLKALVNEQGNGKDMEGDVVKFLESLGMLDDLPEELAVELENMLGTEFSLANIKEAKLVGNSIEQLKLLLFVAASLHSQNQGQTNKGNENSSAINTQLKEAIMAILMQNKEKHQHLFANEKTILMNSNMEFSKGKAIEPAKYAEILTKVIQELEKPKQTSSIVQRFSDVSINNKRLALIQPYVDSKPISSRNSIGSTQELGRFVQKVVDQAQFTTSMTSKQSEVLNSVAERVSSLQSRDVNINQFMLSDVASPASNRGQQMGLFLQQASTDHGMKQQFVDEFTKLIAKSKLSSFNGNQQLSIKLYPEHLGKLDIQLIRDGGQLVAKLMTTTSTAKELIESQLNHLRQAFVSQNINVEKIDIEQSMQEFKRSGDDQKQDGRDNQNKERFSSDEEHENEENSFLASFEKELLNLQV